MSVLIMIIHTQRLRDLTAIKHARGRRTTIASPPRMHLAQLRQLTHSKETADSRTASRGGLRTGESQLCLKRAQRTNRQNISCGGICISVCLHLTEDHVVVLVIMMMSFHHQRPDQQTSHSAVRQRGWRYGGREEMYGAATQNLLAIVILRLG